MQRVIVLTDDEIETLRSGEVVVVSSGKFSSEKHESLRVMSEETFDRMMEV